MATSMPRTKRQAWFRSADGLCRLFSGLWPSPWIRGAVLAVVACTLCIGWLWMMTVDKLHHLCSIQPISAAGFCIFDRSIFVSDLDDKCRSRCYHWSTANRLWSMMCTHLNFGLLSIQLQYEREHCHQLITRYIDNEVHGNHMRFVDGDLASIKISE